MKIFTKRKRFCYCLQAFSTEEILECHIKDIFKIAKKELQWLKKCEYVKLKNYEENKVTIYNLHRFSQSFSARRQRKERKIQNSNTNKYQPPLCCQACPPPSLRSGNCTRPLL